MSAVKSHIFVDCEESLLSYNISSDHYSLYSDTTLNITSQKDPSLLRVLNTLSKSPDTTITIITTCSHIHLLEDYLKKDLLPGISFSVLYVPPLALSSSQEAILHSATVQITLASASPPPGYTLLYNHTLKGPNGGWENHAKMLWQRLSTMDFFCDMAIIEDCSPEKQSTILSTAIQDEPSIDSPSRPYSPTFLGPVAKKVPADYEERSADSPSLRRLKEIYPSSPTRKPSPLSRSE